MKYSRISDREESNPEWVGNSTKTNKKYEDMLFGQSTDQNSATYNMNALHDLLPRNQEEKPKVQSSLLNTSSAKASPKNSTQKNSSSRPGSAKYSYKRYKSTHEPSFVDETLFGGRAASPSLQYSNEMPPEMICRGLQVSSRPSSRMDSRPASRLSSRPMTPKVRHRASFVDDTLFGPKPVEAEWAAPWDKEKPKKPLLFGSSDVKVTINHNIQICKERPRKDLRSAGAGVSRPPSSSGTRPVWK